jgi:hypothetical protein
MRVPSFLLYPDIYVNTALMTFLLPPECLHFQHERVAVIKQPTMWKLPTLRLDVHALVSWLIPAP